MKSKIYLDHRQQKPENQQPHWSPNWRGNKQKMNPQNIGYNMRIMSHDNRTI